MVACPISSHFALLCNTYDKKRLTTMQAHSYKTSSKSLTGALSSTSWREIRKNLTFVWCASSVTAANIPIPSYLISLSLIPAMVCSLFCTFGDSTLPVVYAGVAPSLRTYKSLKHSSGKARIWPGFTYLRTYKSLKLQLFSDIVFHCFTYLRTYKSLKRS